jgi:hypothetical protein
MTDAAIVAATLRAYVQASGALSASALVDAGAVDVDADGSASVERAESPVAEPLDATAAEPLALGLAVRKLPPFRIDAERAEVSGPLGALEHLAEGVRALATALGDRSVALVRFPAEDGETPFALAARHGEGLVVVIGDEQYEMDPSWPADIAR